MGRDRDGTRGPSCPPVKAAGYRTVALFPSNFLFPLLGIPAAIFGVDQITDTTTSLDVLGGAYGSAVDVYSPDFVQLDPQSPDYRGNTPAAIEAAGFKVIPDEVDAKADMRRMLALGVNGMVTDAPKG